MIKSIKLKNCATYPSVGVSIEIVRSEGLHLFEKKPFQGECFMIQWFADFFACPQAERSTERQVKCHDSFRKADPTPRTGCG